MSNFRAFIKFQGVQAKTTAISKIKNKERGTGNGESLKRGVFKTGNL